ncbi:MAG: ATP phosphoribosyltransferase regulatory subunit, partial [Halobacteriota archaeon]
MKLESLKGFRDFYAPEMAARRKVFDVVEDVVRSYGFREVDTPSLERLALYEVKSGEEIVDETYSFEDKGGRMVTLTPELTPSLARMYVARHQALAKPVRWYSTPKLWRYEQPQSGRLREFYQPNFDVFGVDGPEATAELIALAHDVLTSLGLDDEFEFRVSHRGLVDAYLDAYDLTDGERETVHRVVDRSERLTDEETRDRLSDAGLSDAEVDEIIGLCD